MPRSSCGPSARRGSTLSRPRRAGYARLMGSGRFAPPAFSRPGPNRRRCGKSWFSCTATVSGPRGRYGFSRLMAPIQVMTENPYRLARDIRGIGFKTADAIAMKLGIEKRAMIGLRAWSSYALPEAMDEGHCGLPTDQLIPLAVELLEAPKELILTSLEL